MSSSLEMVKRPPEVFVRGLSPEERARLKSISKTREVSVQAPAGDDSAGVFDGYASAADRWCGAHR
jgi:hypothetical protein